jgi:hypothetical protein
VFDYGAVSVALTRPLPHTWPALVAESRSWHDSPSASARAEQLCRQLVDRLAGAVAKPRTTYLTEDYVVFLVTRIDGDPTADDALAAHGQDIAQLLRAEQAPLSI